MRKFTSSRVLLAVAAVALLASCAATSFRADDTCVVDGFSVVDDFSGARRGTCTQVGANSVRLDIRPESSGYINDSPWYAFRIEPNGAASARVTLRYHGGHHRYWPKISDDGLSWSRLDAQFVSEAPDGLTADIVIPLSGQPVWVAAQELVTPKIYEVWNRKTTAFTGVPLRELGESKAGLPIYVFDSSDRSKDVLFLVGRQHPPEVSGAFAFFAFTETVFGDSELAREFRKRFRIIAIPMLNPDGVVGGNWRHNLGSTDLNRDWGLFEQPETALVQGILDELDTTGSKLRMFVDFHSTKENVFYTQSGETNPPGFTAAWLDNARSRIRDYPFKNDRAPSTSAAIAKNYIYARYGIPSVTFEVGDETDRNAARRAAGIFAEELMHLMLEQNF